MLVALEVLYSLRKHKKASKLLNSFKPLPQILENIKVKDKEIIINQNVNLQSRKLIKLWVLMEEF